MSLQERTVVGTEHGLECYRHISNVGHAVNRQSAAQFSVLLQHVQLCLSPAQQFVCPVHVLYTSVCWPVKL